MRVQLLLAPFLVALFAVFAACGDDGGSAVQDQPESGQTSCTGSISWDDAYDHVGERAIVKGPVVDTRYASGSNGKPTFLNLGKPFPDPDRFTVLIWGDTRDNFPFAPEVEYDNETICVTGLVETFEGSAQIIADTPSDIAVLD